MPREGYQDQLDGLREDVLYMGEIVLDRLRMALEALDGKDHDLARQVIDGDEEINQIYLDLERDCIDLLALQQPVAGDLRFIAASFKIITDLERIGDLAVNLGEYATESEQDLCPGVEETQTRADGNRQSDIEHNRCPEVDVQAIGNAVIEMNERAMEAYADENTDICFELRDRDDEIDSMCQDASATVIRNLIEREIDEIGSDAEIEDLMGDVSQLFLTIRDLERIGDHAVNIAARTLYMVENDDELIY